MNLVATPLQKPPAELTASILTELAGLTISALAGHFDDTEYPNKALSLAAWRYSVVGEKTKLSYWGWVSEELKREAQEAQEALKPDLKQVAAALKISNLPAFIAGCDDGREQGFELSMGLSYHDEADQWCYDIGTHLGACLAVHPEYKGDAVKK